MNNITNKPTPLRGITPKKGFLPMHSPYASELLTSRIWPDFTAHFQNSASSASYQADLLEFMRMYQTDFLQLDSAMAEDYFLQMQKKVRDGSLQPSTMAKKFRELHSLAEFIENQQEQYPIPDTFQDYFAPYLKSVAKVAQYARSIPIEEIDRLFQAAQKNLMAYCIFALLQRVGLSSTEITELKLGDFTAYDNGVFASVPGRREPCFVPEDVFAILGQYISKRREHEYLFSNSRGNQLNTMYISRLMKKYTELAGIPNYSAEALRNTCAFTMFSYHATPEQVARQMGITDIQIKRYKNMSYRDNLVQEANKLVKVKIEPPKTF